MQTNHIFNEDCRITLERDIEFNLVITSPPYNHGLCKSKSVQVGILYDEYHDDKTNDEYVKFTLDVFNKLEKHLKKNGVILYNFNYGTKTVDNAILMYDVVNAINHMTNMCVVDTITWIKRNCLAINSSLNKLTRKNEFIFVISRKSEFNSFYANRIQKSISKNGLKKYDTFYNLIQAKNNDTTTDVNKATFSSEMVLKLLNFYARPLRDFVVYDPFMGTGTTAYAARQYGCSYLGSEISETQVKYALNRLRMCEDW